MDFDGTYLAAKLLQMYVYEQPLLWCVRGGKLTRHQPFISFASNRYKPVFMEAKDLENDLPLILSWYVLHIPPTTNQC